MATVQELARILNDSLAVQFRGEKVITVTKDDKPEWVVDVIHAAHGNLLPDDWTYEVVAECAELIANDTEENDLEPEIYTSKLLQWFADFPDAVDYADQAKEEYGNFDSITEQIQAGQLLAMQGIYGAIHAALEEIAYAEETE